MSIDVPYELDVESPTDGTVVETFEWSSREEPSLTIITAVASITGTDPTELEPLSFTLDPDALNSLLGPEQKNGKSAYVQFDYEGCRIRLTGEGTVFLVPLEE